MRKNSRRNIYYNKVYKRNILGESIRKVSVVGAGTSGLICARDLCELGVRASVYDQKTRLGYPAKASGIVSINGLKSLGIGYEKAITNTLYGANIHAGNTTMHILSKKPQAHVLEREHLNLLCYDEAVKSGAEAQLGVKIDGQKLEELHSEGIIVGADGPLSAVAKHFSMGSIKKHTLTYKAEYNVNIEDTQTVDLFFDNRIAPKFFGWLCPNAKDILEVGIGIDSRYGNSKAAFDRLIKLGYVGGKLEGAKLLSGYASLIPMHTARSVVDEKKKVLLVGDAAGQVKPTTGGGIVFGGNAARLAAKVVSEHMNSGVKLGRYEKLFRKRFGTDIKLHGMLNRLYSNLGSSRLGFLLSVMKSLGLESFFSTYGDMDRPSLMLKRFFLRGLAE